MTMIRRAAAIVLALVACGALAPAARAQGPDAPAALRALSRMADLLPGIYDNARQHDADIGRALPEPDRHVRIETTITRIEAPAFGPYAYLWINRTQTAAGPQASYRIATLQAGPGADEVLMKHFMKMQGEITAADLVSLQPADLRRTDGCDYVFRQRGALFRGRQLPRACQFKWLGDDVYTDNEISLSGRSLWFVDHKFVIGTGKRITGVASGEPFKLERTRPAEPPGSRR
jgi:hypothetical protein